MMSLNGAAALETPEFMASKVDLFGTPEAYNHYAVGWAHADGHALPVDQAGRVALRAGPATARSSTGRNGIAASGEIRPQFHHVIDIAPTVLEVAGLPEPTVVDGVAQRPIEGVSMRYAFDDAEAGERRPTQYFEMFCNRGIYHEGWTAVTRHSTPWDLGTPMPPLADDLWELYDTNTDWTQAHDLAAEMPDRLAELQQLWLDEARRFNVLPLDDRRRRALQPGAGRASRPHPRQLAAAVQRHGPPDRELVGQRQEQVVRRDGTAHDPRRRGRRRRVRAGRSLRGLVAVPPRRPAGLLLQPVRPAPVQGLRQRPRCPLASTRSGWSSRTTAVGSAKGGTASLWVDGAKVGEGRVDATEPMVFSADETADVGSDTGSRVSDDYRPETSAFTGSVAWIQIDLGDDATTPTT